MKENINSKDNKKSEKENNDIEIKNEINEENNNINIIMEENNNININNNINLISDEKTLKENKDYFKASYLNFQSYANNAELSIQNEIKNIKKNKKLSINRDLFWKILLGILPYNKSKEWKEIISEERTKYHEAKKQFITNDIAEFIITKKIKDKYSSYFKFKDILSEEDYKYLDIIKIDVTRTFQKIELFKEEKIQEILINVLFIYAKKNKEIGYSQGMSDLCAIFLYVLYKDKFLDASFIHDNSTFDFFLLNSNNEFLENDTFLLFSKFMEKGYSQFFLYSDEKYKDGELSQIDKEKKKNVE